MADSEFFNLISSVLALVFLLFILLFLISLISPRLSMFKILKNRRQIVKFYIPWLIILFFGIGGIVSENLFSTVFCLFGVIFGTLLFYFFHQTSDTHDIPSPPSPAPVTPTRVQETQARSSPVVIPTPEPPVVVVPRGEIQQGEIILPKGSPPSPAPVTPTRVPEFDFPDVNAELKEKIKETIEVQAYLGEIFGTSEDKDVNINGNNGLNPSPNSKHDAEIQQARQSLPFNDEEIQSLDPQFIPILAEALREKQLSEKDFRVLCRKFGCSMHRGVLDDINTWAIDISGDPILLEKDNDISVNPECSLIPEG